MRATLVHNESAGGAESSRALVSDLARIGWTTSVVAPERVDDRAFDADVIVVAGGDGTVAAIATALVDRPGVALAIVPQGTANNVAKSLGVMGHSAEIVEGLREPRRRRIDVGVVRGPFAEQRFLESVGVGLFAFVLGARASEADKPPARGCALLRETLAEYVPAQWTVRADGVALEGRFLLAEAMNVGSIGPNLCLAPDSAPDDGLIDLVLANEDDRGALDAYLARCAEGREASPPPLTTRRARQVRFEGRGARVHVDDREAVAASLPERIVVDVELLPRAIEIWIPATVA